MNLRQFAKGKPCQVRAPNVCNWNPETTVLAHIRRRTPGMGRKPNDLVAVHACSDCHDLIDGRTSRAYDYSREELDSLILAALCGTLEAIKGELK